MRRTTLLAAPLMLLGAAGCGGDAAPAADGSAPTMTSSRLNPLVALHEAGRPQFGLYAPSAGGGTGRDGMPRPVVPAGERAAQMMAYGMSDYVFDGSMEGGVDENLPTFVQFRDALQAAGATARTHPLVVKMAKIEDAGQATSQIAGQLATGVSGVMFVEVESAEEVETALAAMRWESEGGTRPDDSVGSAPAYWGVDEAEYRRRADLWPLDPEGELISWVIVESHEGLANVRDIAAVPGIGVLWPGAGTLRRVFSTVNESGERVLDEEAWENAIQQVLSACKEFDVPCGYPANASDIEMRMEQGFSVFVMGWGEGGFATVEMGRELAGR